MATKLSINQIRESVEGAIRNLRQEHQPSRSDRARSTVSQAAETVREGAERALSAAGDVTERASGSRDQRPKKRIAATVAAVGAVGAAAAYFLRDRVASLGENGKIPTPAGQATVDSTAPAAADGDQVVENESSS